MGGDFPRPLALKGGTEPRARLLIGSIGLGRYLIGQAAAVLEQSLGALGSLKDSQISEDTGRERLAILSPAEEQTFAFQVQNYTHACAHTHTRRERNLAVRGSSARPLLGSASPASAARTAMEVLESGEQGVLQWDRKLSELSEPGDGEALMYHTVRTWRAGQEGFQSGEVVSLEEQLESWDLGRQGLGQGMARIEVLGEVYLTV
ncbi:hypothetical protein P7K49_025730 [Saguinus oedipus]|uniref:Uncharacterized protein n=1 Tax=Saguinus oedipus TaxID=9490 RepID=A0ABQ9UIF9_SAGOE|nr:hypothetical protein P7K49_025730 [Saguinus oedipus]